MRIIFAPKFIRFFKKLPIELQEETLEKIELFKNEKNHKALNVHKLKGPLKKYNSFSVNYSTRIVFEYLAEDKIAFIAVGDHDIYK